LHLKADHAQLARELGIEGPYRVTYHLHPPVLRRLGMHRKLPMGRPYVMAFRVLRAMRTLRGTPLDLFGLDRDRRMERALIEEYAELLDGAAQWPYQLQVELATSVRSVKGYAEIKERAATEWRSHTERLRRLAGAS